MAGYKQVYIIKRHLDEQDADHTMIKEITECYHDIVELSLEQAIDHDFSDAIMLVINISPKDYDTLTALQYVVKGPNEMDIPLLFLLKKMARRELIKAQKLGAARILVFPLNREEYVHTLQEIATESIENSWHDLSETQATALKVSLKVFEDTFAHIKDGQPISNDAIRESCDLIIKAAAEEGLSEMLAAIRSHHNYTYRHSMMVCGYLTSFSILLGITGEELQHLAICGMLHDIGKADVPEELLNKPGPLLDHEWDQMRMHPEHSRRILETSDVHEDVKDGSIHHHEKLDGTGYPDRLAGPQISDFARMVAIADIFSGLTEKRAYKASMSNQKAYDIMVELGGTHLDPDLVRVFKPIALDMD